jgi:hypothetical protein
MLRFAVAAFGASSLVLSGLAGPASAARGASSDVEVEQTTDVTATDPDSTVEPDTQSTRCANSRGGPNCDEDDEPIVEAETEEEEEEVPSTTTTTAAPVAEPDPVTVSAGGGDQVVVPAPVEEVLPGEVERPDPAPVATLPRTGTRLEFQTALGLVLLGAGIASLGLARSRRTTQGTK